MPDLKPGDRVRIRPGTRHNLLEYDKQAVVLKVYADPRFAMAQVGERHTAFINVETKDLDLIETESR